MPYRCRLLWPCTYRLHHDESPSYVAGLILKLWRIRLRCGLRLSIRFLQLRKLSLSCRLHPRQAAFPLDAQFGDHPAKAWTLTEMEVAE